MVGLFYRTDLLQFQVGIMIFSIVFLGVCLFDIPVALILGSPTRPTTIVHANKTYESYGLVLDWAKTEEVCNIDTIRDAIFVVGLS